MVIKAGLNQDNDKQRTPEFYQRGGIPIPEKDLLNPVAEYNRGELQVMDDIENLGYGAAWDRGIKMLAENLDEYSDFLQGYFDALEMIGKREI